MAVELIRKYLDIIHENTMNYRALSDAGAEYQPGKTQIWYWKPEFSRDMSEGYEFLKSNNMLPDLDNLSATHRPLGTLAQEDPNQIFSMMQAEVWSPSGQAQDLIKRLGLNHTSMSVGDIIVINNSILMIDRAGFIDITTGEKANAA